jgi:hypothetical protein
VVPTVVCANAEWNVARPADPSWLADTTGPKWRDMAHLMLYPSSACDGYGLGDAGIAGGRRPANNAACTKDPD